MSGRNNKQVIIPHNESGDRLVQPLSSSQDSGLVCGTVFLMCSDGCCSSKDHIVCVQRKEEVCVFQSLLLSGRKTFPGSLPEDFPLVPTSQNWVPRPCPCSGVSVFHSQKGSAPTGGGERWLLGRQLCLPALDSYPQSLPF